MPRNKDLFGLIMLTWGRNLGLTGQIAVFEGKTLRGLIPMMIPSKNDAAHASSEKVWNIDFYFKFQVWNIDFGGFLYMKFSSYWWPKILSKKLGTYPHTQTLQTHTWDHSRGRHRCGNPPPVPIHVRNATLNREMIFMATI